MAGRASEKNPIWACIQDEESKTRSEDVDEAVFEMESRQRSPGANVSSVDIDDSDEFVVNPLQIDSPRSPGANVSPSRPVDIDDSGEFENPLARPQPGMRSQLT